MLNKDLTPEERELHRQRRGELRARGYDATRKLDHVARAVREARKREGVSQSELARRARISASVVSRLESGKVLFPEPHTLEKIAIALGRSGKVLWTLSEGADSCVSELLHLDLPVLKEAAIEKELFDNARADVPWDRDDPDEPEPELWEFPVLEAVLDHFLTTKATDALVPDDVDPETRTAVAEFLDTWQSITDERREMLLQYMRDQKELGSRWRLVEADPRERGQSIAEGA